jgi:protein-tyrosine-phosphatase
MSVEERIHVLFACAGNTCRSLMAEFIARGRFGHLLESSSAGFNPGSRTDAKNTINTLKKLLEIDASAHTPRRITQADLDGADLVVAMDGWVARQFRQEFPEHPPAQLVRWRIPDPFGDDLEEYERCASRLFKEIKRLVADRGLTR